MKAALLSDVHIDALGDLASRRFLRFVQDLEAEQLFILGDLFHAGWGYAGSADPAHEPALQALEALQSRGCALTFVPGNHDFAMEAYLQRRLDAQVTSRWEGQLGHRRAVLIHGDEADRTPGYRALSWLLRGRGFAALMRALGPERGRRLIRRLAGSSRAHGDGPPKGWLRDAQLRLADELLRGPADLIVMGHSHVGERVERPDGLFVNTGDFGRAGTWLAVDEAVELRVFALDGA